MHANFVVFQVFFSFDHFANYIWFSLKLNELSSCSVYRKNHNRQLESLQATLEAESKAKNEHMRLRKKAEGAVNDLEAQLDNAAKVC